jgi:hypothetical protein
VYARQLDDQTLSFGVSGMLLRDSLVMYDRQTQSLWTQVDGLGIRGPLKDATLSIVPAIHTTWKAWKRLCPDSTVLRKTRAGGSQYGTYNRDRNTLDILGRKNLDDRLDGKDRILGVRQGDAATVFLVEDVQKAGLVEATVGELLVVLASVSTDDPVQAYDRRVSGRSLSFALVDTNTDEPALRDTETGTTWRLADGVATQGLLEGQRLTRVAAHSAFWFGWQGFFPHSEVWEAEP